MDFLFSQAVKYREKIITGFKIFYFILLTLLFVGGRSIYYIDNNFQNFYYLGVWLGRLGLLFYILTTLPGISRRFGFKYKLFALLHIFRRYIGISMYLSVSIHFWFVRGIPWFIKGFLKLPPALFEVMGLTAYVLTFFMFLTSNDFSIAKLGVWWYRIHKLTYIIIFFIFLHVALQRLSIWTVLIGITLFLQITSHLYGRLKQ